MMNHFQTFIFLNFLISSYFLQCVCDAPFKNISLPLYTQRPVYKLLKNKTSVKLDDFAPIVSGGTRYHDGGYFITIGIGTSDPVQQYLLAIDTGSDLTWVQSSTCSICHPPQGERQEYNPNESKSIVKVNMNDHLCRDLGSALRDTNFVRKRDKDGKIIDDACRYEEKYSDESQTNGELIVDTLLLGDMEFPNQPIGLGLKNVKSSGIFGLGGGRISFVFQANLKSFSHCFLDFMSEGASTMEINIDIPNNNQGIISKFYHPQIDSTNYYVDLTEVRVDDEVIAIPELDKYDEDNGGTILDIGVHLSSFAPEVFDKIREAFTSRIPLNTLDGVVEYIDFCYETKPDIVPTVTLVFGNEGNLLVLPENNVLRHIGFRGWYCFMLRKVTKTYSVIGNLQLQHFRVYYDLSSTSRERGQIMFVPGQC